MIPVYVAPVHASACSMAQINGFLAACANGSPAACNTWIMDAANVTCIGCLDPAATNTGALLFDSNDQVFSLNIGGCIALADPTNGPACAAALDPLLQCQHAACNSAACQAASTTDVQACDTAAQMGACSSGLAAVQGVCGPDLGDGGVATTTCATAAGVIAEICGNGS
jgi:hypothetical protein